MASSGLRQVQDHFAEIARPIRSGSAPTASLFRDDLAALIPSGAALVLNTIRWAGEIRPLAELKLPAEGKTAAGLKPGELKMAAQLIGDMTGPWKLDDYSDKFSDASWRS